MINSPSMDFSAEIRIRDWPVSLILGIYPEEQTNPQTVIFDLTLQGPWAQAQTGDLGLSVDYAALKSQLEGFWHSRTWGLIETLAEETLRFCLAHTPAHTLTLEIQKPQALAPARVSYRRSIHREAP